MEFLRSAQSPEVTEEGLVRITSVEVNGLFGRFDYLLPGKNYIPGPDGLMILYGDNGSGKTTLLKLVFSLLSTRPNRGDKTYVARTPFRHLAINFSNGSYVIASREGGGLTGDYDLEIGMKDAHTTKFKFLVEDGRINLKETPLDDIFVALAKLGLSVYFLPDDRRLQLHMPDEELEDVMTMRYHRVLREARGIRIAAPAELQDEESDSHHLNIEPILTALVSYLRRQTLRGSNVGEENATSIYLRIIEQLKSAKQWRDPTSDTRQRQITEKHLIGRLDELQALTNSYSAFGMVASFPSERFMSALSGLDNYDRDTIFRILEPYFEGIEAKLRALNEIYQIVSTYVSTLNSFFVDKKIYFSVARGTRFETLDGTALNPNWLSSGEKQLVLLLSNSILARKKSSIFLIDEPELSLNVKWQRRLVSALLSCSQGGGVQYVLASHSLELLTQYRSSTVRLVRHEA